MFYVSHTSSYSHLTGKEIEALNAGGQSSLVVWPPLYPGKPSQSVNDKAFLILLCSNHQIKAATKILIGVFSGMSIL